MLLHGDDFAGTPTFASTARWSREGFRNRDRCAEFLSYRSANELGAIPEAHPLQIAINQRQEVLLHRDDDLLLSGCSLIGHAPLYTFPENFAKDFS